MYEFCSEEIESSTCRSLALFFLSVFPIRSTCVARMSSDPQEKIKESSSALHERSYSLGAAEEGEEWTKEKGAQR